MEIIQKEQARELKLKKYFTGIACKYGHLTFRYTNTGACVRCISSYYKRYHYKKVKKVVVRFLVHPEDAVIIRAFAIELMTARDALKSS